VLQLVQHNNWQCKFIKTTDATIIHYRHDVFAHKRATHVK